MAGPIKRQDLLTDDALRVGELMSKELQKIADGLTKVINTAKGSENTIAMADSLKKIQEETQKLTTNQQALEKSQKALAESSAKMAKEDAAALEKMAQKREHLRRSIKDLQKDQKEDLQLLKEAIITRKEYDKRIAQSSVQILTYQQRLKLLNKQVAQDIILTKQLGGEYAILSTKLAQAEAKYRDLLTSGKATTQQLREQGAIFRRLNDQVTAVDQTLGKFQRNVGNYPKIIGAMSSSILQLVAAFGIHDGIRMFAHSIKEVISLSIDFETANSRLAGVLGLQKSEILDLRKQQMELAKVTLYNAKSYAELQIELAKLGFPIKDIEKMTESTARASIAMGSDLAEQAELTGSILHQFGLDASQTARINDALSKSTTASALDFRKLATAMPYVGAAASALGFSLEEVLALMGQLSNAGLASSTIGTSLRKIFLLLADSSSELSKRFKEPVRDLPTLLKGLKELKLTNTELGEALELTDIRSVVAFQNLIEGADKVEVLNKTIQDSTGFTEELAHTVKDNLGGDVKLAGSAIDSLSISVGETLEPAMRSIVQVFTAFIKILGATPKFLKENKDLLLALGIALIAYNGKAIATTISNIAMSNSFRYISVNIALAQRALKAFYIGLASNPITLFLGVLSATIVGMNLFERAMGRTAQINKLSTTINDSLTESYNRLNTALAEMTVNEAEFARLSEKEKKNRIDIIGLRIAEAEAMALEGEATLALLKYKAQELSLGQQNIILKEQEAGRYDNARKMSQEFANSNQENNDAYRESVLLTSKNIIKLNDLARGLRNTIKTYKEYDEALKNSNAANLSEEEFKLNAKRRKAYLDLMIFRKQVEAKALDEIANNENESLQDRLDASLKAEVLRGQVINLERQKNLIIEKKGEVMAANEVTLINEQAENAKTENAKYGRKDRVTIVKQEMMDKIKLEEEAFKLSIVNAVKAAEDSITEEQNVIKRKYNQGLISKQEADRQIERVTKQATERAINLQVDLLQQQLLNQQVYETEKLLLVAGSEKEELAIKRDSAAEQAAILLKIQELRQKLLDLNFSNTDELYGKEIENLLKLQRIYEEFSNAIGNLFGAITDRRLYELDREIQAVNDWEEEQLRLAGDNDAAKEQIEINADRRREEFEKKKIASMRKFAIYEKATAVVSAGIAASLAVLNALSTVKPFIPAGVAAGVLAGALGAIQIAAILAKPLPKYEKGGVTDQPVVIAGEKGAELYRTPQGEFGMTPDKASIMHLPVGTEIYPHDVSMRKIAMQGIEAGKMDSISVEHAFSLQIDKLLKESKSSTKALQKAIAKNKPGNFYRQGSLLMESKEDEQRNRKLIRKSVLGK